MNIVTGEAKGRRLKAPKTTGTRPIIDRVKTALFDILSIRVGDARLLDLFAVQREIERVLQREDREGKHILFPIRLYNYLFEVWEHERKADVLSKVVEDFRGWNRNAEKYETAFTNFLKALKAQDKQADHRHTRANPIYLERRGLPVSRLF